MSEGADADRSVSLQPLLGLWHGSLLRSLRLQRYHQTRRTVSAAAAPCAASLAAPRGGHGGHRPLRIGHRRQQRATTVRNLPAGMGFQALM